MDTPLAELEVSQSTFDGVAAHLWSHRGRQFKYFWFAAIVLWALVFLVRLGKPDGAPYNQRRSWYPRSVYVGTLVVAASACGFAMGKSPNPMEGAVKVFKSMVGLACGTACPTGAAKDIVAGRRFAADCYSCARCLTVCPHQALGYCRRVDTAKTAPVE